ncbi:ribonuclease [Mycobacterium sp. 852002-51163_SCH5372311]|uniref:TA system VapC family ribonuclease toxin n=1 Tax=Mycobacterium sp. 852002-51163_SCH5372311 TaxID=1834097 RepID=UPI0007FF9DE1|nr:TA system VapC family ribonuclease toxin [Mycobacterium sp. 852002-51163_SCH5372311]OBF84513.1 ribonuclease [Mycobacterium sp. 852002-51163_SCH5372311]
MTRALLDVNVLVALLDSDHVDHQRVRRWVGAEIGHGWASCAITQNGFVRLISQPRYPSPVPPAQAIRKLANAAATEYHEYWTCSVSLLDDELIDYSRLHGHRQVTDAYLLALATANGGRFATLDQSIPIDAVRHASTRNLALI